MYLWGNVDTISEGGATRLTTHNFIKSCVSTMSPCKVKVPKAKVLKACSSMRAMGIPEEYVKPVLDDLANIYENNWALIEDENYRVLLDAIFERQEVKVHLIVFFTSV